MQITSTPASPALASSLTGQNGASHTAQNTGSAPPPRDVSQSEMVIFQNFETPTKANPQSVVQAQIEDAEVKLEAQDKAAAARLSEQHAEAAARTKSIMGMLPADPSEVTKLMSALAAATSAEAIADIKLNAQPVT
ncbi:MAG: hypothetical protein ACI9PY_002389 [Ascidiaceihabitans sp.]|jgi:hypothetical protein